MNKPILITCAVLLNLVFASLCVAEKQQQVIKKSTYTAELDFEQVGYDLLVEGHVTGGKTCATLELIFEFSNRIDYRKKTWLDVTFNSYDPNLGADFEVSDNVGKVPQNIQSEWYASGITTRCKKE